MTKKEIQIHFGCMAGDIQKQLKEQGYTYSESEEGVKSLRNAINAIEFFYWHDILPAPKVYELRERLAKHIIKKAKRIKAKK